jgi:hypothetical protein
MSEGNKEESLAIRDENKENPLALLNKMCPIDELLTPENAQSIQTMPNMNWVSIFRNSPVKNAEAEILMGKMTTAAVKEGHWVDISLQEKHPEPVKAGLRKLVEAGLVEVISDEEGKEFIRPNDKFVSFVGERLAPYGPKEKEDTPGKRVIEAEAQEVK